MSELTCGGTMNRFGKTFILISLFALASGIVIASENPKFSRKFVKSFKDCDSYSESSESIFEGVNFKSTRKILGWKNGFCKYEETMYSPLGDYVVRCSFPPIQVEELYNAMKDRSKEQIRQNLEIFGQKKDPKTGELSYVVVETREIKGSKAYVAWARYENSPYFCIPEKLDTPDVKTGK